MSPIRLLPAVCFALALLLPHAAEGQRRKPQPRPKQPAKKSGPFDAVHEHIQKGRLAEALEAFDELEKAKADPLQIALGRSRVYGEQGKWKRAADVVEAALKDHPRKAGLHARLAEVLFRTGRYKQAEETARKAIRYDGKQPLAHLVLADLYAETGRTKEALEGYRWFVRYYNAAQPTGAETLLLVARGSLQYARWKSVSQIYSFIVNTLCPDALKNDPNSWQAYHVSGDLLLEKYNRAQALPEFDKALAINPAAVPVMVSLGRAAEQKLQYEKAAKYADDALKLLPSDVDALHLKADLLLAQGHIARAEQAVRKALEVNPLDQRSLGRLAACHILTDGEPPQRELDDLLSNIDAVANFTAKTPSRFAQVAVELAKRNPRPGYFLSVVGETLEGRRKYGLAERFYKAAIRVMPELSTPKTSLGMLYMRVGKTKEARRILDDAFKADPFHVRVSNMRKVLGVLESYETIATPHFVIRVDARDRVLGRYVADYLERIYPQLVKQYGFEPPHRTHFEIYHDARGLSAHEWFSARLVGLPWIHTIGASTGMMVAMTSPTAGGKTFNWARVVKHEFVHIITLQQTKFNIPHWFTEALAVTAEGYPRTSTWNRLLLERVPNGELRTLKDLNDGFIRPRNSLDWQFAYCQSKLYADYMLKKYGKHAIPRLLDAYRRNIPTAQGIKLACGVDLATFEKGYVEYLKDVVKTIPGVPTTPQRSLDELEKAYKADPANTKTAGEYAYALFNKDKRREAREVAAGAIEKNAKEPLAAWVMAKLSLLAEDVAGAWKYLETALDKSKPSLPVVRLLADLKLRDEKYGDAADLLELARKRHPDDEDLLLQLARVYLKLDENDKLRSVLSLLAERNFDDETIRKRLTLIAYRKKDWQEVVRRGTSTLHIDVLDVDVHRMLGDAFRELKDYKHSVREYEVALQLKPGTAALQIGLARTHLAAGDKDKAKAVLDELLQKEPDNAEARTLREALGK